MAPCTHERCVAISRQRRGVAIIYASVSMTLVVGFAAFTVDLSRARSARSELRAVSESAALNAANGLSDNTYVAKAQAAAADNKVDGSTATVLSANVVPGNWTGSTFTANGTPRNAVRVTAERVKSKGTGMNGVLAQALGWTMPDITGSTTVAITYQAPYQWAGLSSVDLSASNSSYKVTSYDSSNLPAGEQKTVVKSNGTVTVSGQANVNADIGYGSNANIGGSATVTGTVAQNANALAFPPGSQVANLSGVTPVYSATTDLTVNTNQTLPGGTYVIKNCNVSNCTLNFTGPTTIVLTGNFNASTVSFNTYNNLPANLKIIATVPGTAINITNPTATLNADFYAPQSNFSYSSAAGYGALRGRGVFNTLNASGAGAQLWYDRALTASSLSKKAVIVQ
jgi:hypothetical protein